MNLAQLEARLEQFFEGAFGGHLRVESIIRAIAHALEENPANHFTITLNPQDYTTMQRHFPEFERELADYIIAYARELGALLPGEPQVTLTAAPTQGRGRVLVVAESGSPATSTEKMERITQTAELPPQDAALLRDGKILLRLDRHIINIGRRGDNHLVLEDSHISRQHCQLRVRGGQFVIFDLNSTHGTRVNGVRVGEHVLRSGDVVTLGAVNLLYVEDDSTKDQPAGDTQIRRPKGFLGG